MAEESPSDMQGAAPNDGQQDLTQFVQNLLQQMHQRFQLMSDSIIGCLDEMGGRLDELEKSIGELMTQAGNFSHYISMVLFGYDGLHTEISFICFDPLYWRSDWRVFSTKVENEDKGIPFFLFGTKYFWGEPLSAFILFTNARNIVHLIKKLNSLLLLDQF